MAAHTTTIALGTGILILPQRNPVVLAKEVATLDALSGGRVLLGVGVGWLEEEFDALGVPFDDRGARTDEYVEAMRALWTQDEATFARRDVVASPRRSCGPSPVDGTRARSSSAATPPAAARRAGRLGDGFFPAKGDLPALLDEMRAAAEEAGRDPDAIEVTGPAPACSPAASRPLDEVGRLAEMGVERLVIPPLAFDAAAIGDALGRFGEDVIART